jgi:hypothetical protein
MSAIEFACKQPKEIPFALTKTQIERIIKIVLKAAHGPGLKGLIQCAKLAFWLDEVIVETSALGQSASDRYPQVAGPIHTILVLAVLGGWAFWHKISADQLSVAANPNRVRFYLVTLFFEWL